MLRPAAKYTLDELCRSRLLLRWNLSSWWLMVEDLYRRGWRVEELSRWRVLVGDMYSRRG